MQTSSQTVLMALRNSLRVILRIQLSTGILLLYAKKTFKIHHVTCLILTDMLCHAATNL